MTEPNGKLKAGELVLLSTGEYSDYSVKGLFRVKKDFDVYAVEKKYKLDNPDQADKYECDLYAFANYLANGLGLIEDVQHRECHLGSYATLNIDLGG